MLKILSKLVILWVNMVNMTIPGYKSYHNLKGTIVRKEITKISLEI